MIGLLAEAFFAEGWRVSEAVRSFEELGRGYQERVLQALFEDPTYAESMFEVFSPEYFTYAHLRGLARVLFDHRAKYREFPGMEVSLLQLRQQDDDPAAMAMATDLVKRMTEVPLNGDRAWIQESSLEFCKRQQLISALGKCLEQVENKKYDSIAGTIREALDRGSPRDHGHDYGEDIDVRVAKAVREPISTGWPTLDKYLGGGWERKTLVTFIAPTGAGKSMFLVNVSAALAAQGLNVLYVTLEMSDFKIGLRHDSWFGGVAIDDVPRDVDRVKASIKERMKGRLLIKEWPTKTATVETIRSHVQRLIATKNFKPDAIVIDYADCLRPVRSYGEKRHELESNYENLRGLGQELNCVVITADQTNRGGLDLEIVTISSIAESYAKATVCDGIFTISRTAEDKMNGTGRLFLAKSRFGPDGIVLPFLLQTRESVRVTLMDSDADAVTMLVKSTGEEGMRKFLGDRLKEFSRRPVEKAERISEVG